MYPSPGVPEGWLLRLVVCPHGTHSGDGRVYKDLHGHNTGNPHCALQGSSREFLGVPVSQILSGKRKHKTHSELLYTCILPRKAGKIVEDTGFSQLCELFSVYPWQNGDHTIY